MPWISAATRVEHRDAALACLMVDSATARPVRGLRCPDVRGRMLRNLLARVGSLRIGSHAWRKQREAVRVAKYSRAFRCNDPEESFKKSCRWTVFADAKKKNPRMGIRGRSRASEIGATDLRKGISRGVCRCRAACADCRNPLTARMRPHRDGNATCRTGWRCGRRVSSEDSAGIRGVRQRWNQALLRWARTLHPYFFDCKHFFHESTDGSTNGSAQRSRAACERCPARKRCSYKRKRAAEAARERIAVEHPIGYPIVAAYFGSSTLSITWITPLLWYTLAMVTLALLPFASVTVTLLPIALNVSGSPCTVV